MGAFLRVAAMRHTRESREDERLDEGDEEEEARRRERQESAQRDGEGKGTRRGETR